MRFPHSTVSCYAYSSWKKKTLMALFCNSTGLCGNLRPDIKLSSTKKISLEYWLRAHVVKILKKVN